MAGEDEMNQIEGERRIHVEDASANELAQNFRKKIEEKVRNMNLSINQGEVVTDALFVNPNGSNVHLADTQEVLSIQITKPWEQNSRLGVNTRESRRMTWRTGGIVEFSHNTQIQNGTTVNNENSAPSLDKQNEFLGEANDIFPNGSFQAEQIWVKGGLGERALVKKVGK